MLIKFIYCKNMDWVDMKTFTSCSEGFLYAQDLFT